MLSFLLAVIYAECHYTECHYAESHYAECHVANTIKFNGIENIKNLNNAKNVGSHQNGENI